MEVTILGPSEELVMKLMRLGLSLTPITNGYSFFTSSKKLLLRVIDLLEQEDLIF